MLPMMTCSRRERDGHSLPEPRGPLSLREPTRFLLRNLRVRIHCPSFSSVITFTPVPCFSSTHPHPHTILDSHLTIAQTAQSTSNASTAMTASTRLRMAKASSASTLSSFLWLEPS